LGKKAYCDILEDIDGNRDIHYRLKSIPSKVLEHKAMPIIAGRTIFY
jgi:hypothetical protein